MQPGSNLEDINTILSRFQAWTENHPVSGNGNGHGSVTASEEIREIPYEEAIRRYRNRQENPTQRRSLASSAGKPTASRQESVTASTPIPSAHETLPTWITEHPVVPEPEPVIELRATADHPAEINPMPPATLTQPEVPLEQITKKSAPVRRRLAPRVTQSEDPKPVPTTASSEPNTPAAVDLPPAPAEQRKTARRVPHPSQPTRMVAMAASNPSPAALKTAVVVRKSSIKPTPAIANSSLVGPAIKTGPPVALRKSTPPRSPSVPAGKPRETKHPPFRQVLAGTLQHSKNATKPKKKPEPGRTRRITARFSPTEERCIEKYAAERGVTIAGLLRECALSAIAAPREPSSTAAVTGKRRATRMPARAPANKTYTAPAPSPLGGWMALLRNRFLGSPVRFSEDA